MHPDPDAADYAKRLEAIDAEIQRRVHVALQLERIAVALEKLGDDLAYALRRVASRDVRFVRLADDDEPGRG